MPYVDPSRRVVLATDADQAAGRPKVTVEVIDNGDGSFSYAPHVWALNPVTIDGSVEVTFGGATPESDAYTDALGASRAAQVVKLRLGNAGLDEGLVSASNPVPTSEPNVAAVLVEILDELKEMRLLMEAVVK